MGYAVAGNLLDACALGALSNAPTYGYELTQKIQTQLGVSESALYPVLRRLLQSKLLASYDEQFDGRNRRYYKLTDFGKNALNVYRADWLNYKNNVDSFLNGGNQSE